MVGVRLPPIFLSPTIFWMQQNSIDNFLFNLSFNLSYLSVWLFLEKCCRLHPARLRQDRRQFGRDRGHSLQHTCSRLYRFAYAANWPAAGGSGAGAGAGEGGSDSASTSMSGLAARRAAVSPGRTTVSRALCPIGIDNLASGFVYCPHYTPI